MFNERYSALPHNCVLTIPHVRAEESELQVPSSQKEGGGPASHQRSADLISRELAQYSAYGNKFPNKTRFQPILLLVS